MKRYTVTLSRTYGYDESDLQPEPNKETAIIKAFEQLADDMNGIIEANTDCFAVKCDEEIIPRQYSDIGKHEMKMLDDANEPYPLIPPKHWFK